MKKKEILVEITSTAEQTSVQKKEIGELKIKSQETAVHAETKKKKK